MTIAVALQAGTTFARTATVAMPNYPSPPVGAWRLDFALAPGVGAALAPVLSFTSAHGSIGVVSYDSVGQTVSLAFLAAAQDSVNIPAGTYTGYLVFTDGSGAIQAGDVFALTVAAAASGATLPSAPAYSDIAAWGTLTDIAGTTTTTTLQMLPRGLSGAACPAPWAPIAAWAPYTVYQVGPPAALVTQGFSSWVCTTSHTSTASFDPTKWRELAPGTNQLVAAAQTAAIAAAKVASTAAIAANLAGLTSSQLHALAVALVPIGLSSLPVYSGSGPAPVATGGWFINNGKLEQAQ